MSATTEDRDTTRFSGDVDPALLSLPVAATTAIPAGVIVADNGSGYAVNALASTSTIPCGVSQEAVDNSDGGNGDLNIQVRRGAFWFVNGDSITIADRFSPAYVMDNQTVSKGTGGSTRPQCGIIMDVDSALGVLVLIGAAWPLDLSAMDTRVTNLETNAASAQAVVHVPLDSFRLSADGAAIPAFSNGVADGFSLVNSKAFGLRINDDSSTKFATSIALPQDLDDAAAVVVHALCSKSGATLADATKLTFEAFFQTVGALHDADVDCGGDTGALTGDATAKTVAELTLSIAAGDVPAAPCGLTLTMIVKNGTLATDDLIIHDVWLEYTRKQLTS